MSTIYSFDTEHAKNYGTNEAVILYNIIFWVKKNKANNKHLHHGKHWTYNSIQAFNELFDFLTKDQVRRCMERLEAKRAIIKDNFNENSYDRTLWYTLSDELYKKYIGHIENHLAKMPNADGENAKCHLAKMPNGAGENATPIPDINTDFKQAVKKHTQEYVCGVPVNQNISLDELRMEAEKVIGEKLWKSHFEIAMRNISIDKFRWHLGNWHIHKLNANKAGAYFIQVLANDIEPVKPQKQTYNQNKIPQRDNFDQREYTDEEIEKFYADLSI